MRFSLFTAILGFSSTILGLPTGTRSLALRQTDALVDSGVSQVTAVVQTLQQTVFQVTTITQKNIPTLVDAFGTARDALNAIPSDEVKGIDAGSFIQQNTVIVTTVITYVTQLVSQTTGPISTIKRDEGNAGLLDVVDGSWIQALDHIVPGTSDAILSDPSVGKAVEVLKAEVPLTGGVIQPVSTLLGLLGIVVQGVNDPIGV